MADRILRVSAAAEKLGVGVSTLYEWLADPPAGVPALPRPRKVGPNAVGWLESELDALIASLPLTEARPRAIRRGRKAAREAA